MLNILGNDYLTTNEAAEMLGLSPGTLANDRWRGTNRIEPVRFGRDVFYRRDEVQATARLVSVANR